MAALRSLGFQIAFVAWTVLLGIAALPVLLFGWRAVLGVSRLWGRGTFLLLRGMVGLSFEIRGQTYRPTGPALVALKHQSAWETLALPLLMPAPSIIHKRELSFIPLVGWYMAAARMIPVDRRGGAAALKRMIAAARKALDDGRQIAIFPEGTRVAVGAEAPFHPGIAALYSQLRMPIVPVAVNSGQYWPRGVLAKRPGRIVLEFLAPVPAGLDRKAAMALLRAAIETGTERLCTLEPNDIVRS